MVVIIGKNEMYLGSIILQNIASNLSLGCKQPEITFATEILPVTDTQLSELQTLTPIDTDNNF